MSTPERRRLVFPAQELRLEGTGAKRTLVGYAALYDVESEELGYFTEIIRRGAFTESLAKDDIRCLWNHDPNHVLGRNKAGTLRLSEDTKGLKFECDLPDTQLARDAVVTIERGDVSQMSFGFRTLEDRWTFRKAPELDLRELLKASMFDVSPVTFAAYSLTEVGVRSKTDERASWREAREAHERRLATAAAARRVRLAEAELS